MAGDCNHICRVFADRQGIFLVLLCKILCAHNGGNKGFPDPFLRRFLHCWFNNTALFYNIKLIMDSWKSFTQKIVTNYKRIMFKQKPNWKLVRTIVPPFTSRRLICQTDRQADNLSFLTPFETNYILFKILQIGAKSIDFLNYFCK